MKNDFCQTCRQMLFKARLPKRNKKDLVLTFWAVKIKSNETEILGLRPANERRYKVIPSLIGWAENLESAL